MRRPALNEEEARYNGFICIGHAYKALLDGGVLIEFNDRQTVILVQSLYRWLPMCDYRNKKDEAITKVSKETFSKF